MPVIRAHATRSLEADLRACEQSVDQEMKAVAEVRKRLFCALDSLAVPINVNADCIVIRQRRKGGDRVNDAVQAKLTEVIS